MQSCRRTKACRSTNIGVLSLRWSRWRASGCLGRGTDRYAPLRARLARYSRRALTDPDAARHSLPRPAWTRLGVAIGNVHILTTGKASPDLEILRRIRGCGAGAARASWRHRIHPGDSPRSGESRRGKDQFRHRLKQAYLEALRASLARYAAPSDPHPYLGIGGATTSCAPDAKLFSQKVEELMEICGSAGRVAHDFSSAA